MKNESGTFWSREHRQRAYWTNSTSEWIRSMFIDTNPELIHQLNQDKGYTIEIIDEMNRSDFIDHVVALNSLSELEEVITATKNADILTTSVGAINLVKIAPIIAQALSKRFEQKHSINIVANENVINASDVLKKEIYGSVNNFV